MSNRRRVKLPRRLKAAFRDYLRHGERATGAVAIISRAYQVRQQQAARDREVNR